MGIQSVYVGLLHTSVITVNVCHLCYYIAHTPCAIAVYMHMYLACVRECMYVECAYSMLAALLPYMLLVYAICLTNVYCVFQH
jgi:hypothetical protein